MNWSGTRVLVTGGASFIGSHLVDALVARGASVRVADDLSSGKLANLDQSIGQVVFMEGDLRQRSFADRGHGRHAGGLSPGRLARRPWLHRHPPRWSAPPT
jgi:nucleoside-diphosphate-sugar epimerase